MSARQLPPAPSFESLRNQAKQLRRALIDQDSEAVRRFLDHHPKYPTAESIASLKPTLADAQCVVAREYGYASWTRLKEHVEDLNGGFWSGVSGSRIDRFLHYACPTEARGPQKDYVDRAKDILSENPALGTADLSISVVIGDVERVRQAIDSDPSAVHVPCGRRDWPPLAYAAHGCFHLDPDRAEQVAACSQVLLDHGADPNTTIKGLGTDRAEHETPVLLAAIERSQNTRLVEQLLEAGADAITTGAYYNTCFCTDPAIMDLLYAHGAPVSGPEFAKHCPGTLLRRMGIHPEDTAILSWFLERGADPNLPNPGTRNRTPLHGAVLARTSHDVLELLLSHGADPRARDDDGRSPVALAVRRGDASVVALLIKHGGVDDATPYDRLLGAAERNDETEMERLAREVDLSAATRQQKQDFLDAAQDGRLSTVKAMLLAGMDIAVTTPSYHATALDRAALGGQAETVQFLIDQGAPLEVKHQWGGTPLNSALHALVHFPAETGDYAAVVDALLRAGSEHGFIEGPMGDMDVDRVLREHGIIAR